MPSLFSFGETLPQYSVPVLNEREARAGAGILLTGATVAFVSAMFMDNFVPLRFMVALFFLDFLLRVLVNPRFAPSLVLGRLIVANQTPEYTGAPQKRFAWALGLALATLATVLVLVLNMAGPVLLAICVICLTLLLFETAFGICLGCKLYNLVMPERAKLCPGGVCELNRREPITRTRRVELAVAVAAILAVAAALPLMMLMEPPARPATAAAKTLDGRTATQYLAALGTQTPSLMR
jgi:hypothetical protein